MADALKNAGNGVDRKFIKDKLALTNSFTGSYMGAFSATNMYVTVRLPYEDGPIAIGSLAALSISTHRDVFPVTNMYNVNPRGFTQGHRTTAGTMIFHTIDRNAFFFDRRQPNGLRHREAINGLDHRGLPHPDTLPLFDVHINYINEEGMVSSEGLFGVRLLDFGKTMSFENLHPMESYSFMALEYEPMRVLVSGNSLELEKQFLLSRPSTRQPIPTTVFGPPVPKTSSIDPDIIKLNDHVG
jgi:hypothetical protein